MFKNFLKITFRNLWKTKGYSFLNIAGLAIGIACAALIFLWVEDELTFNQNFAKKDYLYKVYENQTYEGKINTFRATSGPLANALKTEIPGIKNAARLSFNQSFTQLFSVGDKAINEQGCYADSSIFSMLALPFVHGGSANAFNQLHSIVISNAMAIKFFGNDDPVGKTLKVNNESECIVTGVFETLPQNSTLQFQWLAPFELFEAHRDWLKGWNNNGVHTLVELQPGTDVNTINEKLVGFLGTKDKSMANVPCFLFSMNDWHLHNEFVDGKMAGGEIKYVRLFSIIAWVILLIACINFMNLATARSEKRAKEVGLRKVMGVAKSKLISQFVGEALIMSFLSVLVAVLIIFIALPGFNMLIAKQLPLNIFSTVHLISLLAIGVFCGLTAGSYPAFYLSSFNPATVLKGIKIKTNISAGLIRKGLVVAQFAISTVFIICTVIIYQQVRHISQRDLGYDKNNLLYLKVQGQLLDHFDKVSNDLKATGFIENTAVSDDPLLSVGSSTDGVDWQGKDQSKHVLINLEHASPQYINVMKMRLAAGRDFYSNPKADSANVIINEAMAKQMDKEGKIGSIIQSGGANYTVVGIAKDFVYNDVYGSAEPLILFCAPLNTGFFTIRFKKGIDLVKAMAQTEAIMKTDNPGYPFDYAFVNDDFNLLFKSETLIEKLAAVFAILAVFISCLGLFGLAAYTAERRTKEIGIRKVLGASIQGLVGMLSKEFIQLVGVSCIIAFPVSWWAMHVWLQDYAYRTDIQWWVFGIAGISALAIALVTVSFQAVKAAMANPVKGLRSE